MYTYLAIKGHFYHNTWVLSSYLDTDRNPAQLILFISENSTVSFLHFQAQSLNFLDQLHVPHQGVPIVDLIKSAPVSTDKGLGFFRAWKGTLFTEQWHARNDQQSFIKFAIKAATYPQWGGQWRVVVRYHAAHP